MQEKQHVNGSYARALAMPVLIVCALASSMIYLADAFLHHFVTQTIASEAEQRAGGWSESMVDKAPELALISDGTVLEDEALDRIMADATADGVFRIHLFSPDGGFLQASDDHPVAINEVITETARQVFLTGELNTSIFEEIHNEHHPESHVETYLQVVGQGGEVHGVVKVFIDTTNFSNVMHHVFHKLSRVLIVGLAVVYLVPSLVLIFKAEQLRQRDRVLLELSSYDPLTGLLNRRELNNRANNIFNARVIRSIGVLFVDVDRFKQVNDELGHEFGDRLLEHIAKVINDHTGPDDLVGRVGGDEFMVILPTIGGSALTRFAQDIQIAMREPFSHNGTTITPSISSGAHVSAPGETLDQAIHAADLATYRAKANGRGQLVTYTSDLGDVQDRRRHVEGVMRSALGGSGGFFVAFQPIFSDHGKTLAGFEALLRLEDRDGTTISPAEFIPIAEESGLIIEIGQLTLLCVLRTAKDWPPELFVSVNLSAVQFKVGGIVEMVRNQLETSGFDPSRLELEVTESLLLEDEDQVSQQIDGLRALGLSISLDDFGTGFSSLGYLWKYKFDKLKIDRVFLQGFDNESERYRQVIGTIVTLGHTLGMKVNVEGIESETQLLMLGELGCDQFQGFLLGRPEPRVETEALIQNQAAFREAG